MRIGKAYILRIDNPTSIEYSKTAAESCERVGLPYEFFEGFNAQTLKQEKKNVWDEVKKEIPILKFGNRNDGGSCATAGHFMIWKKILDNKECAVILEHDAIMLHKPELEIFDNEITVLGYKCRDPENYDHVKAGPPKEIIMRKKHGGAHAYAMTYRTAENLLNELQTGKFHVSYIDNCYFFGTQGRGKHVKMSITDPICAIGWLRDSTIWSKAATDNYGPILPSFLEHYDSNQSLEIKK